METKLGKSYKIAIIGGKEVTLGFRLSGITEIFNADDSLEMEKSIRDILQRDDVGLVMLSSQLARGIKDRKILNTIDSSMLPVFIEIPGYKEEKVPDTLRKLIIRAIGIDISKTVG